MRTPFVSSSPTRLPAWPVRVLGSVIVFSAVSLLSGCKQNVGERCQLTDDCAPGLVCEFGGNTPAMGGYCKDPTRTTNNTVDMSNPDQASPVDMSTTSSDML